MGAEHVASAPRHYFPRASVPKEKDSLSPHTEVKVKVICAEAVTARNF